MCLKELLRTVLIYLLFELCTGFFIHRFLYLQRLVWLLIQNLAKDKLLILFWFCSTWFDSILKYVSDSLVYTEHYSCSICVFDSLKRPSFVLCSYLCEAHEENSIDNPCHLIISHLLQHTLYRLQNCYLSRYINGILLVNIDIGNTSLASSNEDHDFVGFFFLLSPTIIVKTSCCC